MSALSSIPMPTPTQLLLGLVAAYGAVELVNVARYILRLWRSQLRKFPGPRERRSVFFGNALRLLNSQRGEMENEWVNKYGQTFAIPTMFGRYTLWTIDPRALQHIFNVTDIWWKPDLSRRGISRLLGNGILVTEGEQHKIQRKIMNPAFSPAALRELNDVFLAKAAQLRDIWKAKAAETDSQKARVEVLSWFSKATLDIIGLAGFNYQFDALNESGTKNSLAEAFDYMFRQNRPNILLLQLRARFPLIRPFLRGSRERAGRKARQTMDTIGMQLIQEKKRAIEAEGKEGASGRDLLTVLLKANMATDIPENQRLSDADVLSQVPTFLVAGHETTSTAMAWCLFALARKQEVQTKLREELMTLPEQPSMDMLGQLPYLDAVVRETLRLHTVVGSTSRAAMADDVLPLSSPVVGRDGVARSEVQIRKGDLIHIPIMALNRSREIWGLDATEFNPDRWKDVSKVAHVPGVMPGLLSFLHGQRSCIGWRFAVLEMKALLFELVRSLKFELAVDAEKITYRSNMISRPMIIGEKEAQMPLYVSPVEDM